MNARIPPVVGQLRIWNNIPKMTLLIIKPPDPSPVARGYGRWQILWSNGSMDYYDSEVLTIHTDVVE